MKNYKYDVVALGELLIDFTDNGSSSQGNPLMEANPGGAPCNVLSMLQNLGNKTAFIGKVGDDMFGHMLADVVASQGIDVTNLSMDKKVNTTLAFVHTGKDGDRSFSFYRNPGADMMLRINDFDASLLGDTKVFHFGTLSMTDSEIEKTTRYAVDIAKRANAIISFDPNYRPLLWDDADRAKEAIWYGISQCDILKISDDEIEFLTATKDIESGIEKIRERHCPKIICATLGSSGSMAFYDDIKIFIDSYKQPNVIETTGAGDTFMACLIHGVLDNGIDNLNEEIIAEILKFANAAASVIVTKKGALKVMPTFAEVEAVLHLNC